MPIKIPGLMAGTSRKSGIVAKERIYERGRLLYAKGAQIKVEDVARLGYGPAPEVETEADAPVVEKPKTTRQPRKPKAAAPKKPAAPKVARGGRGRKDAPPVTRDPDKGDDD